METSKKLISQPCLDLTLSVEDFPVSHIQEQGDGLHPKTTGIFGLKLLGVFGKLRPDGSCAKTCQVSLITSILAESSETWPHAGLLLNGIAYRSWCQNVRGIEDLRNRPDLPEPLIRRSSNGFSKRMDRLGNAVVPQVAEWIGRRIVEAIKTTTG